MQQGTCHQRVKGTTAVSRCRPPFRHAAVTRPSVTAKAAEWAEDRLVNWLISRGGKAVGVKLARTQGGQRALTATEDQPAGRLLISVPTECQVRYDQVTDPRLLSLFERVPRGSDSGRAAWQYKQALTLLYHCTQGENSPLNDYLAYLPGGPAAGVDIPEVGMRLAPEVVEELQDPYLIQDILNHKYWLPQFYDKEIAPLRKFPDSPFGKEEITMEQFGNAVAIVISRCFGLKAAGSHSMPALIDMADHSLTPNCDVMSDKTTGIINLTTIKPIKAGDPILVSYGKHCNADLLLSYGFVLENNIYDSYTWTWDMDTLVGVITAMCGSDWVSDPVPTWQLELLHAIGLPTPDQATHETGKAPAEPPSPPLLRVGGARVVDGRLLGALRVLLAPGAARVWMEQMTREELCDWDKVVTHEKRVMTALSRLCVAFYQSFPTTIQQDRALLESLAHNQAPHTHEAKVKSRQVAMAVTYRLSVKLALEKALQDIMDRKTGLDKPIAAVK